MRRSTLAPVIAACAVALLAGCSGSSGTTSSSSPSASPSLPAWSYSGSNGPANWGSLSPAYAACSDGKQQSPIDIVSPVQGTESAPTVSYRAESGQVLNDGHKIEMISPAGNELVIAGTPYELEQVHYHAPAETLIAGKRYPAEFHWVHEAAGGKIAVAGTFITAGAENPAWQPFIDTALTLQNTVGTQKPTAANWSQLLTGMGGSFNYQGSLTTPPCTEGLNWFVNPKPVTMSQRQIDQLTSIYDHNDRPVQPLNGRQVTIVK